MNEYVNCDKEERRGKISEIQCANEETVAGGADFDERAQAVSGGEGASYNFEV